MLNILKRHDIKIEVVLATQPRLNDEGVSYKDPEENARHEELIRQYCLLRKSYKKNDPTYPEGLGIPGDKEAGFLLAVQETETGPKVVAGFRLNEIPAGKDVPATGELTEAQLGVQVDKIEEARVKNLFPGIEPEKYAMLNMDGAMFDTSAGRRVLKAAMDKLLEGITDLAKERRYDAVSFVPSVKSHMDRHITDHFEPLQIRQPVDEWPARKEGDAAAATAEASSILPISDIEREHAIYDQKRVLITTDHGQVERKGDVKRILSVVLNAELSKHLSSNAAEVA